MKVLCIEKPIYIDGIKITSKDIIKGEWYYVNGYTNFEYIIKTIHTYKTVSKKHFVTETQLRKMKLQKLNEI